MLKVAFVASHLLWMLTGEDVSLLYDTMTEEAAAAIHLTSYGLALGYRADLIVLNHNDVVEALRFHDAPTHVIKNGRIIDLPGFRAIGSLRRWAFERF
jgi:cytosine/creatinine deaminase